MATKSAMGYKNAGLKKEHRLLMALQDTLANSNLSGMERGQINRIVDAFGRVCTGVGFISACLEYGVLDADERVDDDLSDI